MKVTRARRSARWAVVVVDGNGNVVVMGVYRYLWTADLMRSATGRILERHEADDLEVYVEPAGPTALGELLRAQATDQ